jgi:hypothetical protein
MLDSSPHVPFALETCQREPSSPLVTSSRTLLPPSPIIRFQGNVVRSQVIWRVRY